MGFDSRVRPFLGAACCCADEVALWRAVMDFLHDVKEEDEEEEEEEEEDDEDESPPPEEPVDDLDGPELIPDAGEGLSEAAALEQAAASAAPAAPAPGATGLAAAVDSALAVVPLSADRRAGLSGPPSTAGSVPATAESLQADLREMFRPDQEPVGDYLTRISRIVLALRAHGVAISSAELDGLATKASLLAEFGQVGGDWHPTRMVRRLRARFAAAALKEGDDADDVDVQKEIQAIGELIIALGGKQSASADKVWSSPSDVPPEAAGATPPAPPTAFSPPLAGSTAKAASKAPQPVLGAAGLGAPTGPPVAAGLGALAREPAPAVPKDADGLGLEALKRGSDGGASVADGGQAADLAAALKEQTEALKEALSARGGQSSITTVKTDLVWPTLTDDKSDTKDVVLFYEEFEDVCALANNCRGMSAREKLLALRARCKGSRAKTYTNAYRAAWKTGEVTEDPEAVYLRIKNKHLMFGESREEREVRIDGEHQALVKGRLSGHQFEPLFEASVADLESVGLGKTPRELYLSYLRKMPPHLQKEIRQDKRIWPGDAKDVGLRSPATWEESHKVVLEYEQREAAHRAVAHSTSSTTAGEVPDSSAALAKAQKEIRELKAAAKAAAARPSGAAAKDSTLAAGSGAKGGGKGAASKICFHFRDHGNCPKGGASRRWLPSEGRAPWPLRAARAVGKEAARLARPRPSPRPSRRPHLSRHRSLLALSVRSSRRRARAGRVPTATWCTVCWPGRVKPCRPTGALLRERP